LRHDGDRLSDERPSDVLGALPRRRPHRRSDKRASPALPKRSASSSARRTANGGAAAGSDAPAAPNRAAATAALRARGARKTPAARRETPAARREAPTTRRPSAPRPERLRQPAQPAGVPPTPPRPGVAEFSTGRDILGIAAQAAAELAEIGLSVSARVLRNAVSRLPRP